MINYKVKNSYGIFNFEMIKEEEQSFRNMILRFDLSKPLVQDDLSEVLKPLKGGKKNRSERKVIERLSDDMRPNISGDEINDLRNDKK
jgi:hypothetical protein